MRYIPVRVVDIIENLNSDLYLPAIQREFVWKPNQVERLFDSIMSDYPIGSFLYWLLKEENKDEWPIYEFIRNFDDDSPHNPNANMAGINRDIHLILDGQQRVTSLNIGLRGSYRHFYYRWKTTKLYLDLLKNPKENEENSEELSYGFAFLEESGAQSNENHLWYLVGNILNSEDAEDAKEKIEEQLSPYGRDARRNALKRVGKLHNRIHTAPIGNYYEEKSQDYEKVLQIFVRANSAGESLGYSDLLLSTATAQWKNLNARDEIHQFTDELNDVIHTFSKDFVLKACLYLTNKLPIQYKVKNFTKPNLLEIESNWDNIKAFLFTTARLIKRFGFSEKNVVAPLALLPIALYIMRRGDTSFDKYSDKAVVGIKATIRRWFIFSTLKGAFGGSSDTTLGRLRELLCSVDANDGFPEKALYKSLEIEPNFNDDEMDRILEYKHGGKYTYLVLSLLYSGYDFENMILHEDHIFPQSEFGVKDLKKEFGDERVSLYLSKYNTIANLELLTDSENIKKSNKPFREWVETRDANFRQMHLIPKLNDYSLSSFDRFVDQRSQLIKKALGELT